MLFCACATVCDGALVGYLKRHLVLMWTGAMIGDCHITVMAQDAILFRESLTLQKMTDLLAFGFPTMLAPTPIDVVDTEKFVSLLPATSAFTAVVCKGFLSHRSSGFSQFTKSRFPRFEVVGIVPLLSLGCHSGVSPSMIGIVVAQ
jgi:hypothetical protein